MPFPNMKPLVSYLASSDNGEDNVEQLGKNSIALLEVISYAVGIIAGVVIIEVSDFFGKGRLMETYTVAVATMVSLMVKSELARLLRKKWSGTPKGQRRKIL